jgi:signal transduction histidine kinase
MRKELARGLHDGPLQLVSGIMMRLDFCRQALKKEPALLLEEFGRMQELAESAVNQMRTLLFELRPLVLETEGLEPALNEFLEHRQKATEAPRLTLSIETFRSSGEMARPEAQVEAILFSIVREAVDNALRHARADNIEVHLIETPAAIQAMVLDDGVGFDVDQIMCGYGRRRSLGLINIKERGDLISGDLNIRSAQGRGTCITICVPKT